MKLKALDLVIAADTIRGSLSIINGGNTFSYTTEARKSTMNRIYSILENIEVDISKTEECPHEQSGIYNQCDCHKKEGDNEDKIQSKS